MTEHLTIQQMADRIAAKESILLLCHKNPDGDTIGSASALCHALLSLGKQAAVLCSDEIPAMYAYMQTPIFRGEFTPAMVVAVDVASVQLFGEKNNVPTYVDQLDACIDHHAGNLGYANFTLLDATAAATAEIMIEVIAALQAELTPCIANCLYTALSTDTGCFRFASTTARTYRTAAQLFEAGAAIEMLNTLLFQTKSRQRMEIERIALSHLSYHLDNRCALLYLTYDQIANSGVEAAELEDLTSLPISIADVQVGLTLRQQPSGSYRISIRTAKEVDACVIAKRLGGGGHSRAAGCELEGDLENTIEAILGEVKAVLALLASAETSSAQENE